jgi:hypothetical protein
MIDIDGGWMAWDTEERDYWFSEEIVKVLASDRKLAEAAMNEIPENERLN